MAIRVILSQAGPLPLTATFQAPGNSPMYIEVNGSVWTQTANKMIGIAIALDGNPVGTASIFSNLASTHRAVVPAYIAVKLSEGPHKLTLTTSTPETVSDLNDLFTAVIHF